MFFAVLASMAGPACASGGNPGPRGTGGADDAALAAAIERRIAEDEAIDGSRLRVRVSAGVATLEGVVASSEQVRRALRHAARVEGVRQVVNRLIVVESGGRVHFGRAPSAGASGRVSTAP